MDRGSLVATGRVFAQGVSLPISLHSISQASVLMLQSQASVLRSASCYQSRSEMSSAYLGSDDVELELLPVIVGLLECLNLS